MAATLVVKPLESILSINILGYKLCFILITFNDMIHTNYVFFAYNFKENHLAKAFHVSIFTPREFYCVFAIIYFTCIH